MLWVSFAIWTCLSSTGDARGRGMSTDVMRHPRIAQLQGKSSPVLPYSCSVISHYITCGCTYMAAVYARAIQAKNPIALECAMERPLNKYWS